MSVATGVASRALAVVRRRRRRSLLLGVALLLVVGVASCGVYAWRVEQSYARAKRSADAVQAHVKNVSEGDALSSSDLDQLSAELATLQADLNQLNDQLHTPLFGTLARNAPVVSDRVKASESLLNLGIEFTDIARQGSDIAIEIRTAFQQTGFATSNTTPGPTWLDVVRDHRAQIDDLQARYDAAVAERQTLDDSHLTSGGRSALATVDKLIARAQGIRDDYVSLIPLLDNAMGAQQDASYFVLLQNAEEIRPGGGFPGTYALITVHDGRLADIQISSIVNLDKAYVDKRTAVLPAPGPIQTYLKQLDWLPHDAIWSPDFPTAAQDFLKMYSVSGWPPLQGVIALDYSAVQDVLRIIGPYQVTVQGETQTISADGIIPLIEEYRETNQHKKVVGVLGRSLIDQLKATSYATKKQVFKTLEGDADSREIQVYMLDPQMQAQVVQRGWDGALDPAPGTPTLAMTVASLAGGKSSTNIYANSSLAFANGANGATQVTWTITFAHKGDPNGDPKYNGFHRTWVQLYLPDGAQLVSSSLTPDPAEEVGDPRAIGYNIGLLPGDSATLTVTFDLPTPPMQLLLRRQPGFNNVKYTLSGNVGACVVDKSLTLKRDAVVDVAACTVVAKP